MRGSIVKRPAGYYIVVEEPRGPDGKRKQRWHGKWATKRAAEDALPEIVGRVQRGEIVTPSKMTLGDYLQREWLPAIRATVKPSTHELYETMVQAYVVPGLGRAQLQVLSPGRLTRFYGELLASGGQGGRPLAPKTVRNVHGLLHRALKDAARWRFVVRNVAADADAPRVAAPTVRAWEATDLAGFLAATVEDQFGPLWRLIGETGLRRGEALALRWEDIDLQAGRATICRSLAWVRGEATFAEPKTRAGRRLVPLAPSTVAALKAQRRTQAAERLAAGPIYEDAGLVFCREDGLPLKPEVVSKAFVAAVKRAGLPPLSLHGLRHTWATLALGAGVPTKVASEVLGHASTAITADLYQHVTPGMAEGATRLVADLISDAR